MAETESNLFLMTLRQMIRACDIVHVVGEPKPFIDLINRGKFLDMTVQRKCPHI